MDFLQAIKPVVTDMEATQRRFMNNIALWKRFALMFPSDPSYGELLNALEAGDEERIIRAAHTLKGTAANLGFDPLSKAASQMVEHGRSGYSEQFPEDLKLIRQEYDRIVEAIQQVE